MIEQRSQAWRQARVGKITASRFNDVIAIKRDGKPTAARDRYMKEITFQRLCGIPCHEISSKALIWGSEVESFAREVYELETGHLVTDAEFITHTQYPFIGCSPDGLIDTDGCYESKCPMDEVVHLNTWLNGMPKEHIPQIQGSLLVTGRQWSTFVSYDPRMRENLRLYYQRIERDNTYINEELLPALLQFEMEVKEWVAKVEAKAA